jgi:hypothetical protein
MAKASLRMFDTELILLLLEHFAKNHWHSPKRSLRVAV